MPTLPKSIRMTRPQDTAQSRNKRADATDARLSWRENIGYGLGDMGFNFYWTNISTFLLIFYTDVFGITAGAAATMMLS